MTDWCLVERLQEVMYGSTDNIVWWSNVPILVVLNVPGEVELGKAELLQFLLRKDVLGTADHWLYHSIEREEFDIPRPKFILLKLGGELPDEEMKSHITQEHEDVWVYDWLIDNSSREDGPLFAKYPTVKNKFKFYKRYDILPHEGWEYWEHNAAEEEGKSKEAPLSG